MGFISALTPSMHWSFTLIQLYWSFFDILNFLNYSRWQDLERLQNPVKFHILIVEISLQSLKWLYAYFFLILLSVIHGFLLCNSTYFSDNKTILSNRAAVRKHLLYHFLPVRCSPTCSMERHNYHVLIGRQTYSIKVSLHILKTLKCTIIMNNECILQCPKWVIKLSKLFKSDRFIPRTQGVQVVF